MRHRRSVVHARHGMVAAAHPLAVGIGLDVLKEGGTAVDAALAANAALGFLEPAMCGIGGDLFALVWDAGDGTLHGLNASGPAPATARIERIPPEPDGTIPLRSPCAWTVPGCVDGWFALHDRFGRLPIPRLLAPAIAAAGDGAPVPRVIAAHWAEQAAGLVDQPGFAQTFLPGGRAPREGDVFRNRALAETYRQIADEGRAAFYEGAIAAAVVELSAQLGGFLGAGDLSGHHSSWTRPISTSYRGVDVHQLPPSGQGLATLQILRLMEEFDLRSMGRDSPERWHLMIEAVKLVYEDRARHYADPAFRIVPVAGLLSRNYARRRAALIDPRQAARRVPVGRPPEDGDTTYLAVADRDGNMVSLIQSLYLDFGTGHTVAGFALHNRGAQFSLDPEHANALRPGKRPFHTIIPAFATRGGGPWLAFGVMGGAMQPQGQAQVLVNLLDLDMDLQEAGDAPRFRHVDGSEPTGTVMTDGGAVLLEEGVPDAVREGLLARGHRIREGGSFGGYQAVARDPGSGACSGATESRKDGLALGY